MWCSMLSSLQTVVAGSTLRRAVVAAPLLLSGDVVQERSLRSTEEVFSRKIASDGNWSATEKSAVDLMLKTAKALDRKFLKPVKGVIWLDEPASRCYARIQDRGQPADTKIKASELYKLEQYHSEMMANMPADVEIARITDVTQHRAPWITREICRWIWCLKFEGSTSKAQRDKFGHITITVSNIV